MSLTPSSGGPIGCAEWDALVDVEGFLALGRNRYHCQYVVYTDGTHYYAEDGTTGQLDYGGPTNEGTVSGTNARAVIQAANDSLTNGGEIVLKAGTYTLDNAIQIGDDITLVGEGPSTILDVPGTTVLGAHIDIRGKANWRVANMKFIESDYATKAVANGNNAIGVTADGATKSTNGVIENIWGEEVLKEIVHLTDGVEKVHVNKVHFKTGGRRGIYVINDVTDVTLSNITIDTMGQHGIWIGGTDVNRITVSNVLIKSARTGTTSYGGLFLSYLQSDEACMVSNVVTYDCLFGIYLNNSSYVELSNIWAYKNQRHGVLLEDCTDILLENINVIDNSQETNNTYDGLHMLTTAANNARHRISNINAINTGATGQRYGIMLQGTGAAGDLHVVQNYYVNGVTGGILNETTAIIGDGVGFVVKNNGTATIAAANTAIVVPHGCNYTPAAGDINPVLTNQPTNDIGDVWVDTIGVANFTINCRNAPGVATAIFAWSVDRH